MTLQALLGNFALILFVLTVATGLVWFLDMFYLSKQRRARADAALAEFDARNARLAADGMPQETHGRSAIAERLLRQPTWVEYSGSFFSRSLLWFLSCVPFFSSHSRFRRVRWFQRCRSAT
jgi:signal peptidase I